MPINPKSIDPDLLYSSEEAARLVGLSANGLRYMKWCGKLPARKVGKRLYFRGSDLLRLLGEPVGETTPSEGEE